MLILHGIGEQLDYWTEAQLFLASYGIASLVFDYSGYGKSDGTITPSDLRQDVIAAFAQLQNLVPAVPPPFVLGLSLGTGIAVDAEPYLQPAPSGVILCEAFSSLRSAMEAVCRTLPLLRHASRWLAKLMPALYAISSSVYRIAAPLLNIHSDADELFPVAMGEDIYRNARSNPKRPAEFSVRHGFAHNEAYLRPPLGYWQPILDFIGHRSVKPSKDPASAYGH